MRSDPTLFRAKQRVGQWTLLRPIGHAKPFAAVFEARSPTYPRAVLKQYRRLRPDSDEGELFWKTQHKLRERLNDPGAPVARIHELFSEKQHFVSVSEWVEGRPFKEAYGSVTPADNLPLAIALADAVAWIHARNIAHRDLKPDNILLTAGAAPILLDFDGATVDQLQGYAMGTKLYSSPEHLFPKQYGQPGKPADVFSLGFLLYELLTDYYPLDAESIYDAEGEFSATLFLAAISNADIPSLNQERPICSQECDRLIRSCMGVRSAERPTADKVAEQLRTERFRLD